MSLAWLMGVPPDQGGLGLFRQKIEIKQKEQETIKIKNRMQTQIKYRNNI